MVKRLLDKYKENWFLVADYFLEGFIFIGYAFVENKWQLFALQVFLGLASALGDPSWESLFDRHTPNRRSGSSWALSHFFPGCLTAFGIILGTYLIRGFGFKTVFLLGSIFAFAAGIVSLLSIKNQAA